MGKGPADAVVACGTCTLCCHNEMIILLPGDDRSKLLTVMDTNPMNGQPVLRLAQKPNGACGHLEGGKCSVYEHRPQMCRAFSCVDLYKSKTLPERREIARGDAYVQALFQRARELIEKEPSA